MRRLFVFVFLLWLVQIAFYWLATSSASLDGHFPSPQPDTKLYCQSARRIAEGHPFSYSEGESVSTGTTSVIYPFVLAVPYVFGATGERLLVAGFFLNGIFYLIFLLGWTSVAARWMGNRKSKYIAVSLLGLAAQPAACAFGQSDTGLWMATSAIFVAALSWRRMWLAAFVLVFTPWVRPEGILIITALAFSVVFYEPRSRSHWLTVGLGVLSAFSVFAFNWYLTGRVQFDSVAYKGYFKIFPLADAIGMTLKDGMSLVQTFFTGTSSKWPQSIYFIPLLSCVFLFAGIAYHRWNSRRSFPMLVMWIAVIGSFCLVASSEWQGTNLDRYLAWTMPMFLLFIAEGVVSLSNLPCLKHVRQFPIVICLAFYAVTAWFGVITLHKNSRFNSSDDEFQRTCAQVISESDQANRRHTPARVGGISCTDAYDFSARRFYHLSGIYSPDFLGCYHLPWALETLKRRPEFQFEFWSMMGHECLGDSDLLDMVLGPQCVIGPHGRELREADWSAFNVGEVPLKAPDGKRLIARLDTGYLPDEKVYVYEVIDRWGRDPEKSFFHAAPLKGRMAVDCARSIQGGDMFTIPLLPQHDCIVTMRTLSHHGDVVLKSPVKMLLQVDGQNISNVQYEIDVKTNAFQEVSFCIPGFAISNSPCRIGLLGDHIVSGYWFWQ